MNAAGTEGLVVVIAAFSRFWRPSDLISPIKGDAHIVGRCFTQLMCRWMAYSGEPILAEELLFRPAHSIIDQSLLPPRRHHNQR